VGAQEGEAAVLPDSFSAAASASALRAAVLTPALVPVEGLFDFAFVEGRGTYEPANQEGRSSLVFPGNGGVSGPGLLCGTFLGPEIPPEGQPIFGPIVQSCTAFRYPLAVYVDSLSPDAQTEGALALGTGTDPISLGAVGARAHAGIDAMTTDSEATDLRILGAPAFGSLATVFTTLGVEPPDTSLVRVDGMTATTDQRIVDGRLVTEARATVTGLRLLGGLVRIGSIDSRSRLVVGGDAEPEIDNGIEVSGVEVGGAPAQLTEDGLVAGDPSSSTGPLAQQLASLVADALQESGFRISTLPSEQGEDDGIPFASSGGLLVEFSTPLAGLPPIPGPLGDLDLNGSYGVRVQVGATGVRGFADTFGDDAVPAPRDPVTSGGGGGDGGGSSFTPGTSSSGSGSPASPTTAAPVPTGSTDTDDATPARAFSDLVSDRVALLYLSFTLTALGLCLAPRLTLPSRLPSAT